MWTLRLSDGPLSMRFFGFPLAPGPTGWWAYAVVLGMVYWDTEPDEARAAEFRRLPLYRLPKAHGQCSNVDFSR